MVGSTILFKKKKDGGPLGFVKYLTNLAKYFRFGNVEGTLSPGHLSFISVNNINYELKKLLLLIYQSSICSNKH